MTKLERQQKEHNHWRQIALRWWKQGFAAPREAHIAFDGTWKEWITHNVAKWERWYDRTHTTERPATPVAYIDTDETQCAKNSKVWHHIHPKGEATCAFCGEPVLSGLQAAQDACDALATATQ